jgi:autotransporter-associated beta strand protein/predicted outer membrane repeat protein
VTSTVTLAATGTISTREIKIDDDATLTILRSGSSNSSLFQGLGTGTLAIGPAAGGGTGRIIFKDVHRANAGGAILNIDNAATVTITGADFIGNRDGNAATGVSGVFQVNGASAAVTMRDVFFDGNFCHGNSGVARVQNGSVSITSGTFLGNYALNAHAGAFGIQTATGLLALDNVLFDSNRAKTTGGAIDAGIFAYSATWTNVVFNDNWAGTFGGAIRSAHTSGELVIKMTGAGGVNYYNYTGNIAANSGVTVAEVETGTAPAAVAAGGGFYYGAGAGALRFDIDTGVILAIGDPAAADKNVDSIANAATATSAQMIKTGAGDLLLNADNSNWHGAVSINAGALLLDNAGAKLGGTVTTGSGALFGGAGAHTGAVIAQAGSIIQIGAGHGAATDPALAARLSIDSLTLQGATLRFDLFEQDATRAADHLAVASLAALSGNNIIDVSRFFAGAGTIATITGGAAGAADLAALPVTIGGRAQSGARQIMRLSTSGNDLLVTGSSDNSRALTWTGTGAVATTWDDAARNWSGSNDVATFAEGDKVVFNDTDSPPATRAIAIAGSAITVSGMEVDGAADYSFTGAAITADAVSKIGGEAFAATGKLVKNGPGKLTLANTGANDFKAGIDLHSGTLALASAGAAGTSPITVGGVATLQAGIDALVLANTIDLGANTLTIDTQAHAMTLSGAIAGTTGGLAKIGAGTLALTAANTFTGALAVNEGVLVAATASTLGSSALGSAAGTVAVAAAGTLDIAAAASSPFAFTRALAGAGNVNVSLAATADAFSFANNTSTFTGTLRLRKGTLTLDENAAAALAGAGANLVLHADAVAQKSGAAFSINSLTLAGGRLNIETTAGAVPGGSLLTVATLDLGTGNTAIGVDASQYSENQYNPAVPPALNLLDQDGAAGMRLVAAGAVTGSGDVTLTALDGSALAAATASVVQAGGGTVATASYSHAASKQTDGIYMGYGLSQIDIHAGKTLTLDNTGAADSTLSAVLTGAGAVEINAAGVIVFERQNTHAGATIVSTGTLQPAAAAAFAASASVEVKSGAALDLGGHDQTAQNLAGAGAILLGSSTLTAHNTGTTAFSGAFAGAGKLVKTGAGKLSLTGPSAHTGGVDLADGTLAIAHNNALGTGVLTLGAPSFHSATLVLATDNLTLANPIALAAAATLTLTLDAGANTAALAGVIAGAGALAIDGTGTVALSGANTFGGGLRINTARVVAAASVSAIGAGAVAIGATSTLEFRDIASGSVNNPLTGAGGGTGGAVEIANSTLTFGGANALQRLTIGQNAALTAGAAGALGGATSDVAVGNGGALTIGVANTAVKNLTVAAGGRLVFHAIADGQPMLNLAGALTLQAGSTLALGAPLTTGRHTLARAAAGITDAGAIFDAGGTGLDLSALAIDANGHLTVGAVNQAAKRGKDTAAAYDAMTASIAAVHARIGESFLAAGAARRPDDPANGFWLKGIATFGDRDGGTGRIGYKDDTRGAIAGFDYAISEKLLLGAYAGFSHVKISTDNRAETNADLPCGGAYGVMRIGPVYAAGDITIGTFDADTSRFEQTGCATGEYNAHAAGGGVEIGTVFAAWKNGTITPAVAVRYMSLDYHEQSETGPGAILVDNFKTERWEGLASVRVSQGFVTPWKLPGAFDLLLGWRAALKDEENHLAVAFAASPADTFTLIGDNYDRGAFLAGLGVRFALTRNSHFSAGYDYETAGDYNRHSLTAVIRLAW